MRKILLFPLALLLALFAMAQTPVAYYPFTGNANDAIGSNNGTVNGAVLTTDRFGNANSAYSFDGADDFISTVNLATNQTDNWTMTAWIKPSSISQNNGTIVLNGFDNGVTGNGYGVVMGDATNAAAGNLFKGLLAGVVFVNSGFTFNTNNIWYHTAMVREAGITKLYLNGVLSGTTSANIPNTPSGSLRIGSCNGIRFWNGAIDEVKIYNTALTPAQVLAEFGSTTGQNYRSFQTGNWSSASTWEVFNGTSFVAASAAPANTDGIISILSGHTVTVNTAVTADQIVVDAGGTLTQTSNLTLANGAGDDLTVNGTWNWQSGAITGPGIAVVAATGNLTFTTGSQKLIAADITSNGTINWQDGIPRFVDFKTITNNAAMTITSNTEMEQGVGGAGIFVNNGTVTKTSTGTTTFSIPTINNIGSFNCNAGNTQLGNGFSNPTFTNTGNLTFNSGTFTLISGGCTFNHNTGSVISGTGNFTNNSGGLLNLNINQEFPSTLVFTSSGTINGVGNLTINHDFTIQGNILGTGSFTVVGNITWNIGFLTRILTIDAGRTLTFATASQKSIAANIINNGIMNWQDGTIRYEGFAIVTNNGVMNITGNNNFEYAFAGSTFINNGTITKSSTGTTQLDIPVLSNIGTFNCNAGTLINFSTNFTNTGSLNLSGSTFNNGPGRTFNHNTGSVISGTGNFNNSGTINFNINQVFPASIIFASDNTIAGVGDLTINNDFTIQGNVSGGSLTINANTTWVGTNLSRIFTNQAGRTFTISGAGQKNVITNITNNGTMDWQGGTMRYEGPATITNNGLMTISGNNNFEFAISGVTLINNGTITKTSTGTTQLDIPLINNNGTFNCNAGTLLNFGNTFTNTGSLVLNGGVFTLGVARTFSNNTGGFIKGNGTVTMNGAFNSNGIIAPGLSPGIITMNGSQTLSANSTLQIEMLNGSGAGTGHDLLERAGNLTLAGTITVTSTVNVPVGTYTIINLTSGTVSGSFATVNIPSGTALQINATNVQLIVSTVLPLNLISFSGSKQNNDALLQWKTANEINVKQFEVQRSNDGQTFITIGTVAAGGSVYSLTDANTFSNRAVAFYRLKSIDIDGRFTYSSIIKLSKQTSAALTVYPNPVSDVLTINGLKQNGTILLYNAEGKLLQQQTVTAQTMTMDMSKYAKGIYLLQYKTEDEVANRKIIKQ